jgi:hypothetical protein
MKRWFHSLTRFQQIGVSVLAVHVLVILVLLTSHIACLRVKVRKPIAIQTVLLQKPVTAPVLAPTTVKKTQPPSPLPAKKAAAPPPVATTPQKKQTNDLLSQIAESLENLATTTKAPKSSALILPPSIQIKADELTIENPNYREMVSAILQNSLDLPEFGKVVASLKIGPSGSVVDCQILDSQSRKNAEFLKKRLQELSFPCFNQFGIEEKQLNFTVTFQNAENT